MSPTVGQSRCQTCSGRSGWLIFSTRDALTRARSSVLTWPGSKQISLGRGTGRRETREQAPEAA